MGNIIMIVGVVAIGLALGLLRGGRFDAILAFRMKWWPLLVGGAVLHAFAENVDVWGATSWAVVGMFAMISALVANYASIRGALIAAFGLTMNLMALVLNGAVPIRFEALGEAGIIDDGVAREQITSVGHVFELETADTQLAFLGDVIPLGPITTVISIGDLVTFAGAIVIIANAVGSRRAGRIDIDAVLAPLEPELVDPLPAGVLDLASGTPVIDVTEPSADPDDLWADDDLNDDFGVRVLGPTTEAKP